MMQFGYPHSRLTTRLDAVVGLSEEDRALIGKLPVTVRNFAADHDLVRTGEAASECWLLLDGYLYRHKETSEGRRQILSVYVPGDIPDLASLYLSRSDHTLSAMGPAVVAYVPHSALQEMIAASPALMRALQREMLVDAAIFREWILNIGTRQAVSRVAHLLCEIATRLQVIGFAKDLSFTLPMSQADVGEATGISTVHANRVIQDLRLRGAIEWRNKTLRILDWDALVSIADFSPAYLHLRDDDDDEVRKV
jgi:CRP-like cAMP-binding protein